MRTRSRIALPFALLLAAASSPAAAQMLPGARPVDARRERQQYTSYALREYTELLEKWSEALQKGDARSAARLYSEGALVMFDKGDPISGRPAVEQWITDSRDLLASLRTGVGDFLASGSLAYATGTFTFERRETDGSVRVHTGTYLAVLSEENGGWKVRSQVFHVEPAATGEE